MSTLFLPNDTTAPVNAANNESQAVVDSVDWGTLVSAFYGNFVLDTGAATDLQVTSTGTLGIQVNVGTYKIGGAIYTLAAAWTANLSAADGSHPRFDLVVIDSTQTPSVIIGTPNANPCLPTPTQDLDNVFTQMPLAAILVPTSASSISSTNILSKRVMIGAVPFGNYVGSILGTRMSVR